MRRKRIIGHGAAIAAVSVAAFIWGTTERQATEAVESVIVQATSLEQARAAVEATGGAVTHELGIINAVGTTLTATQRAAVEADASVRHIFQDATAELASQAAPGDSPYIHYPALVDADDLHEMGVTGDNVTVAILDSGMQYSEELQKDPNRVNRVRGAYNAISNEEGKRLDKHGHGSHMASIILNTDTSDETEPRFNSIAPDVDVVVVKAFDKNGQGTYADVIRGLEWILNHRAEHDIRVLNLSFSAPPQSHYWEDPLNQAVMAAWKAGIVVVASAGNTGPDPMSIGVPGNNPYVITVGAMTDEYTPTDRSDDRLTSFSAAGPTYEGFVKPDVVAPGGHMTALTRIKSKLAGQHPEFHDNGKYFTMSGTSQSAAVVSGVVALMIQRDQGLSPDEVKYRLMANARPAVASNGNLAYTVFQQGAGMVNAYDAAYPSRTGYANQGLDIDADLNGTAHFQGRANQDAEGNYYIEGLDGYMWNDGFMWNDGYMWNDGFMWSDSLTESAAVNVWVDQE